MTQAAGRGTRATSSPSRAEVPPRVSARSRKPRPLARRRWPLRVSAKRAISPVGLLAGGAEVCVPEPSLRGGVTPEAPDSARVLPPLRTAWPSLPSERTERQVCCRPAGWGGRRPSRAALPRGHAASGGWISPRARLWRERRLGRTAPGKGGAAAPGLSPGKPAGECDSAPLRDPDRGGVAPTQPPTRPQPGSAAPVPAKRADCFQLHRRPRSRPGSGAER